MKISKIEIHKFRDLSNISINFSSNLNVIAGQNGTSKTTILGLIGHIFTFPDEHRTLSNKKFTTQFSEIFKFAYPKNDPAGNHAWETSFESGEKISAISYDRKEKGKEEGIRIKVGKSDQGGGKIKFPVIYFGMARLFPINLEKSIKEGKGGSLTPEELRIFKDLHNEILLINHDITPKSIECSSKKNFFAVNTDKYDHLGNSAGQDNLSQIITALVSFKRLQKKLGEDYQGGILLIDELDASLFPAAQMQLVQKLYKKSLELKLQIFYTTHSLEVLAETKKCPKSSVIFLDNSYGDIDPKYNLDPLELSQNLLVSGPNGLKKIISKKYVYCEDDEAVDFLKNILPKKVKEKIEIFSTKLGERVLKDIAKKKIPDFKNSIIILDGDCSSDKMKNVMTLPGEKGPDNLIFHFLKGLNVSHDFWKKKDGYNYQFCFRELTSLNSHTDKRSSRIKLKEWYKQQKKYWGNLGVNAWKLWIKANKQEVDDFVKNFEKLI